MPHSRQPHRPSPVASLPHVSQARALVGRSGPGQVAAWATQPALTHAAEQNTAAHAEHAGKLSVPGLQYTWHTTQGLMAEEAEEAEEASMVRVLEVKK